MQHRQLRDRLEFWQRNTAASRLLHGSMSLLQVALFAVAVWSWHRGWVWLTVVIWIAASIVAHNKLVAFHEAAHGLLYTRRWINEVVGQILGYVSMVPLTAYRIVHGRHHAVLGTRGDLEFWPFVDPTVSRTRRVLAVTAELLLGYVYDPLIVLRGVWFSRNVSASQRRRAFVEYGGTILLWGGIFALLTWYGWWAEFCVGYLVPAYVAAGLNSWRRMVEHLGLLGETVESKTRMVLPAGPVSYVISTAILRIDHHATHHRYGRIPYYHLPEATQAAYAGELRSMPVFPSYWSALGDMLPHVANPRIGAQWLTGTCGEGRTSQPGPPSQQVSQIV